MIVGRQGKQRQWRQPPTFLPDWTPRDEWDDTQVCRFAVQKAVRALGAATSKQIKQHYTRQRYPRLSPTIKQLVKEGILIPVAIRAEAGLLPGEWLMHRDDLPLLAQIEQGDWQPRTTLLSLSTILFATGSARNYCLISASALRFMCRPPNVNLVIMCCPFCMATSLSAVLT
ncbi:MAG: winged helix DNA-binding domain-containing protein [Chloroflexi bacterium]|nr:winged helix DNA-binding domain-containing protein [Chloroflexota bacterium]